MLVGRVDFPSHRSCCSNGNSCCIPLGLCAHIPVKYAAWMKKTVDKHIAFRWTAAVWMSLLLLLLLVQKAVPTSKSKRRLLPIAFPKNLCVPRACTPKALFRSIPWSWRAQTQRHQIYMCLLKSISGSVESHPQKRCMDCTYRFWVTLSLCKGY